MPLWGEAAGLDLVRRWWIVCVLALASCTPAGVAGGAARARGCARGWLGHLCRRVAADTPQRDLRSGPHKAAPPDAGDVDLDGITDAFDCCPVLPEDYDGIEDSDGCPDCDDDDGIPDADRYRRRLDGEFEWTNLDRLGELDCRHNAEDLDGDADADGCPDL